MSYPEHEKLHAVVDRSQAVGEFLEWAGGRGLRLLRWVETDETRPCDGGAFYDICQLERLGGCHACRNTGQLTTHFEGWVPGPSVTELLAEHFGIDLDVLEAEKRAMLESVRVRQP